MRSPWSSLLFHSTSRTRHTFSVWVASSVFQNVRHKSRNALSSLLSERPSSKLQSSPVRQGVVVSCRGYIAPETQSSLARRANHSPELETPTCVPTSDQWWKQAPRNESCVPL